MRFSPLTPSEPSNAAPEASWMVRDGMGERLVIELAQGPADTRAASLQHVRVLVWAVRSRDEATRRTILEIYRRLRGAGRPHDHMATVDALLWEEIGRELVLAVRAGRLVARRIEDRILVVEREATDERALGPDSAPSKHAYKVLVVDDTGAPVAGAQLTVDIAGDKQDTTTDGSGRISVEKSVSDTATVTLNNREELVDKLWPQWAKPLADKPPPGDQITQAVITSQLIAPLKAPADWLVTLVLTRPPIWRVRMVGMVFDGDKCFLLPQALDGIRSVVAMHRAHPAAKVLIVGHEGGDEVQGSVDLALGRAKILADYLTSKPDDWMTWFASDKPDRQRWGVREVQLMLSALTGPGGQPLYDGSSPGVMDGRTVSALKAFQAANGLTADGKPGSDTRKALVNRYMAIEDTSLAAGVTPVAHGCTGHEDDTITQDGLQPDDRRLEVLFFDTDIRPAPSGDTSDGGSPEYPA
ncbi:MAG: peptidoglycan-binding protein, partial [Polyangiaceae bacterium]